MRLIMLCGALAAAFAFAPAVALAGDADRTAAQIDAAIATEGAPPASSDALVPVPSADAAPATGNSEAATLAVALPANGAADTVGPTQLFAGTAEGASVAVQPTDSGLRVLVHLDDAGAPERYPFTLGGDVARMQRDLDGSVSAYDINGQQITHIAAPWARDARGRDVPTFY